MKIQDITKMAHSIIERQKIENSFIEYKKSINFKASILKTACAYANNYMNNEIGLVFIGIEEIDDKKIGEKAIPKRPISGINESKIEGIENELKSLLSHIIPKIHYHLLQDQIDHQFYIIVAVEPNSNGPCKTIEKAEKDKNIKLKSGRYIRIERDTKLPNNFEEFELLKKFTQKPFSSELNETATLDDLNYEYIKEYLIATNAKEDIKNLSKEELAKSLGLAVKTTYGGYRAKNFAVLMFTEKPNNFIPNAHVEIIRERKNTDQMESKKFDGPIWIQAKQVVQYFLDNIQLSYTLRDDKQIEHKIIYNYPLTAFEEIATNAIIHKDYDNHEYVGIYVYKDYISFINHNRPLPPVTIDDLNNQNSFDRRKYLNAELKDMFFALNLIESYGSGIRRAKEALSKNESPNINFYPDNEEDNYTQAVMKICPKFEKTVPQNISETQKKIFEIIMNNPKTTIKKISDQIGLSYSGVRYNLDILKELGLIKFVGSRKSGEWEIHNQ